MINLLDMTLATNIVEKNSLEVGEVKIIKVSDNILNNNTNTETSNLYSAIDVEKWVILPIIEELLGKIFVTRKRKKKKNISNHQTKVTLLNLHIMLYHIVILELKKFFVLHFFLGKTLGFRY
jgi:hypothetical protein